MSLNHKNIHPRRPSFDTGNNLNIANQLKQRISGNTSRSYVAMQGQDGKNYRNITARDYSAAAAMVISLVYISTKLIFWSNPGSYRYYLAGGICASLSHTITTPIDVVKVSSFYCVY